MTTFAYSHSDQDLVNQPVGYWSSAAGAAVVNHIRTTLAEHGLTQPQWWVLNQLLDHPDGRPLDEVVEVLKGYLEVGEGTLLHNIGALRDRGLVAERADGLIALTDEGRTLRDHVAGRQQRLRAQIHEGISDEEYVRALKVLQRMIHNVGGTAWHH
ncbi:winged helix DNA-binding protein [Streptomyces sp. BG9H]|uniref:Winged helix DNA-binding protein n=1 Tax=Streptomyces anatolicus TaxID=2675858 RepID=A0ABS6YSV4_9ACTN|nr:MarR family winged helix-turn-helix transcriptional regulator [Streptomyces anatolicus]MBW5424499.1 winged helix DNA-binding protein [Streptomyces anatolicus]